MNGTFLIVDTADGSLSSHTGELTDDLVQMAADDEVRIVRCSGSKNSQEYQTLNPNTADWDDIEDFDA